MTPNSVAVAAQTILSDINEVVAQTEVIVGPLISIGNDGKQTVLTFDSDPPAPAVNAVIAADVGGKPGTPAKATLVCRGVIYIAGVKTASSAYRAG